jgi:hypothetical protein
VLILADGGFRRTQVRSDAHMRRARHRGTCKGETIERTTPREGAGFFDRIEQPTTDLRVLIVLNHDPMVSVGYFKD